MNSYYYNNNQNIHNIDINVICLIDGCRLDFVITIDSRKDNFHLKNEIINELIKRDYNIIEDSNSSYQLQIGFNNIELNKNIYRTFKVDNPYCSLIFIKQKN